MLDGLFAFRIFSTIAFHFYTYVRVSNVTVQVLHPSADTININVQVWDMYFRNLLPGLVREGDDGNYGSTATCDTLCLQVGFPLLFGTCIVEDLFNFS